MLGCVPWCSCGFLQVKKHTFGLLSLTWHRRMWHLPLSSTCISHSYVCAGMYCQSKQRLTQTPHMTNHTPFYIGKRPVCIHADSLYHPCTAARLSRHVNAIVRATFNTTRQCCRWNTLEGQGDNNVSFFCNSIRVCVFACDYTFIPEDRKFCFFLNNVTISMALDTFIMK